MLVQGQLRAGTPPAAAAVARFSPASRQSVNRGWGGKDSVVVACTSAVYAAGSGAGAEREPGAAPGWANRAAKVCGKSASTVAWRGRGLRECVCVLFVCVCVIEVWTLVLIQLVR